MYDTILIPTDGSEHAVRAAEHGLSLAERFDAGVHVINVVDVQAAAGVFDVGGVDEAYVDRLEAAAEETIEEITELSGAVEVVETAVVRGDPKQAILEYAVDHDADLIAMGTHGRTGIERYVAGSVCEQVVRRADATVLTTRATAASRPAGAYDEVLIPTDGSDAATVAIEHGIAIARATDARVHAVNVVDLGAVAANSEYTLPTDLVESLEDRGRRATDAVADRATEAGLDSVTAVRTGYPARDLLEYVADEDVDLVAMGTAGRSGLSRFLLGSTAERVIRHADVPVVSVNARDRTEGE